MKKIISAVLILGTVLFFIAGCEKKSESKYKAKIIVTSDTVPVTGAAVTIDGNTAITDGSGAAVMELAGGTYEVTISKIGYKDGKGTVMIGNSDAEITLEIIKSDAVVTDGWSPGEGWALKWSDEFDTGSLNTNNWAFQEMYAGQVNNEHQKYVKSSENCYIAPKDEKDGMMVIKAIKTGSGLESGDFTSARMISYPKQNFMYGKIAARIKVPYGKGIWPAFWMLGSNCSENPGGSVGWPKCGEIDIMEKVGGGDNERKLTGTIHYWNDRLADDWKWEYIYGTTFNSTPLSEDFHVYEIEWNASSITWRFDGKQYHYVDITNSAFDEFRNNFFLILNIAVGGNMPGDPDSTTVFPQYMYVDWVRVYQKQ